MPINTNAWNRRRYTLFAPVYDLFTNPLAPYRRRSIDLLHLVKDESVLILGAGTGGDLPFIPPNRNITAVDITPAMVERLQRRAAELGRTVDARVMDGQALTFPDEAFDAVVLHLILAVVPDPVACLREVARVLKPGGRAVVFDKFVQDDRSPSPGRRLLNVATNAFFSDITRQLGPIVATTPLAITYRDASIFGGLFQMAVLQKPTDGQ